MVRLDQQHLHLAHSSTSWQRAGSLLSSLHAVHLTRWLSWERALSLLGMQCFCQLLKALQQR